jgi:hypothetical protein
MLDTKMNYLPDDIWYIVKEYAGIYSITTEWNKIMKVGVDRLHQYYKDNFNWRLTNVKSNPQAAKKKMLNFMIKEGMSKANYVKLYDLIKPKISNEDFTQYNVGDEIIYTTCTERYPSAQCGVITKINKGSVRFAPYLIGEETRDDTIINGQVHYTLFKTYWDKNKFESKTRTIKSNFYTKETAESDYYYIFDYMKRNIDWMR